MSHYISEYFSVDEIEATGAKFEDIQPLLLKKLDLFRADLGKPVYLIHNGMTTGHHKSEEHPAGRAADIVIPGCNDGYFIYKRLIDAGFNRIGVYFNGQSWSFHAAYGARSGFWSAYKARVGDPWIYDKLRFDLPSLVRSL